MYASLLLIKQLFFGLIGNSLTSLGTPISKETVHNKAPITADIRRNAKQIQLAKSIRNILQLLALSRSSKLCPMNLLITICARKGSKGLHLKNIRPLCGKPLIIHSIEVALGWQNQAIKTKEIIVSTDSDEISNIAKAAGAKVPFIRPSHLANDSSGKLPVISHAIEFLEKEKNEQYDLVLDLDPTAPIRSFKDLDVGLEEYLSKKPDICFSVTKARKNPYFNMVEKDKGGIVNTVKQLPNTHPLTRQSSPTVWDMNASVYFYNPYFLRKKPSSLWEGKTACFEMPALSAYDIDTELDFSIVEMIMKKHLLKDKQL
ncbi:MAG: acylneuraminate cytidylyltransferase family protein [Oligoflexia bacterium]|nr:acylneuraminate cytidylyltransferase family protein [Oligoflexia bacterium]